MKYTKKMVITLLLATSFVLGPVTSSFCGGETTKGAVVGGAVGAGTGALLGGGEGAVAGGLGGEDDAVAGCELAWLSAAGCIVQPGSGSDPDRAGQRCRPRDAGFAGHSRVLPERAGFRADPRRIRRLAGRTLSRGGVRQRPAAQPERQIPCRCSQRTPRRVRPAEDGRRQHRYRTQQLTDPDSNTCPLTRATRRPKRPSAAMLGAISLGSPHP